MLNEINYKQLVIPNGMGIKIDRIFIFVKTIREIEAFRALNLHYFEFTNHNLEQGTTSIIFFCNNIALELIIIKDRQLAARYSAQTQMNIMARTEWRINRAIPFGFVLRCIAEQPKSRRRCYSGNGEKEINSSPIHSQISFDRNNLQELKEPACYIVPESFACESLLDNASAMKQRILLHQSRTSKLTNIHITLNTSKLYTNAVSLVSALNLINIEQGNYPKLQLKFERGCQREFVAVFSTIPMTVFY